MRLSTLLAIACGLVIPVAQAEPDPEISKGQKPDLKDFKAERRIIESSPPLKAGDTYELDYHQYGPSMRMDFIYRVGRDGKRQLIQRRVYNEEKRMVAEAAFLQKNGTWREYGDANLPPQLQQQIAIVDPLITKRTAISEAARPQLNWERGQKPGELGDPVLVTPEPGDSRFFKSLDKPLPRKVWEIPTKKSAEGDGEKIICEKSSSAEFVTCNGEVYRKVTGLIQQGWTPPKSPRVSPETDPNSHDYEKPEAQRKSP